MAVLVLAGIGTGTWWLTGRDKAHATSSSGSTTSTVTASLTTLQKSVSATGTLTPTVQESVSFAVSGTVTAVDVKAGDTVKKGQQLATVDTLQLNASLLTAKANLISAQAKLADLKSASDGSATATAQIAAATANVKVAQAAETAAQTAMGEATLTAPVAGLLTSVSLNVGDVVTGTGSTAATSLNSSGNSGSGNYGNNSSSSSSSSSSGQFQIVGTDAYEVSLSVSDTDVALIAAGDQVQMTSTDLSGTVFGVVRTVGPLSTSSGTASYPVTVDVTGDTSSLHDGISVTAEIIYERRSNVLTIPTAAITTANGASTVQKVASDGSTSTVKVTTGETSGTTTEITAGLAEGDQVQVTTYARTSTNNGNNSTNQNQQGYPGGGSFPGGGQFQIPNGMTIQRNSDGSVSIQGNLRNGSNG
ncbi:MAG: biotin/lipoyl-binding protein [Micrococcales bacterium]|nr:biotin/lipoyl-binding protein [Micrococcales bacterium]